MEKSELESFAVNLKTVENELGTFSLGKVLGHGGTTVVREATLGDLSDKKFAVKFLQSRQAYLSGLSFQGRMPQYKLRHAEGALFDEPIALRTGKFRETCATCGSRLTCNGCSNCGACES